MMIFDSAGREVCSARREVTVTSLQALVLMNDPQFVEASRAIAMGALGIASSSEIDPGHFDPAQIDRGIQKVVCELTSIECPDVLLERLRRGYEEQVQVFRSQPEQAAKLLGVGQWKGIDSKESTEQVKLAAFALIVNAILNTDGFTMMR